MHIYVVKKGDTLSKIAKKYQTDIEQVARVNQLDEPNTLIVGEALVIPQANREYVVQNGDTLVSIANRYNVTIEALANFNNITNTSMIYVGEMLQIPYISYRVKAGDTLWVISNQFGVSIDQIAETNNISPSSTLHINQLLQIPAPIKPVTEVNAYTTQTNELGKDEVLALGRNFTYLSPFMYSIKEDGTITQMNDNLILEAAQATSTIPMLILTNFKNRTFDSDLAATIFRNSAVQEKLITNLITKMKKKGYKGINLDFEYVYPEDRENYNNFLRKLVDRMHPEGFFVSTALAPKEKADQSGLLYEAHDYAAQGRIVDFIIIMTYEWGWAGGEPWAIAPLNKVRDILDYAVTVIPRNKIMMGMPLYGRDWKIPWVKGTLARTVSPKEAIQLATKYGVQVQYEKTFQSPFFRYTDETGQRHEVWFEDARSVQAKYDVVKEYGLRGVSYWVLGNPFPQNWPVLQGNFKVKKV